MKAILEKSEGGRRYSRNEMIVLFLMLIAVGLFRYNGIVYFVVIPVGFALFGMIAPKRILIGSLSTLMVAVSSIMLIIILDKSDFVTSQSRFFIERMKGDGIVETMKRIAMQYPTLLDVNIIKKRAIWYDTWYRDSGYTQDHYDYAKKKQYHEWIRYLSCDPKSDRLYRFLHPLNVKSVSEPWVFFTWDPFYLLYVFLICFFYRLFPLTAAYGYIVLSQVLILLWVLGPGNYNWRYYYFLMFSLCFLIPVIALDIQRRLSRVQVRKRSKCGISDELRIDHVKA
ncbi:MAG: hypothetical protein FJZ87_14205 [Chloroflexi bacterium]|nr:hypothetical protein [Chloroflexota bacterium]